MCGSCGSAPGRHWSTPFLATVPARSSAARAVTAVIDRLGVRVIVAANPAGYVVTTATGHCTVATDLGEVWARLHRLRGVDGVLPAPPLHVASAGPATVPPVPEGVGPVDRRPADLLHRLPAVLAWLAGVDGYGPRGLRLTLGLTPRADIAIEIRNGTVVRCAAVPARAGGDPVELDDPGGAFAEPLASLLSEIPTRATESSTPQSVPQNGQVRTGDNSFDEASGM